MNQSFRKEKGLKLIKINNCEVCLNKKLFPVLDLGLHPMCDDLVKSKSSRKCEEYPIEILYCKKCNTAHQKYQIPKRILFPKDYHYRARFTSDVLNGMKDLVSKTENIIGNLDNKNVLDIGCNDGSLLDFFKEKGSNTFGIEPTDAFLDAKKKNHKVYNSYLSSDVSKKFISENYKTDIITFTNVFAHISNLNEVINSLKILISNETILVIENHYLGSVIEGNQFDTFYHEHPRTYSATSFEFIAKRLGLSILKVEFPKRYGGNIRVIIGPNSFIKDNINKLEINKLKDKEDLFFKQFKSMNENIINWKHKKNNLLNSLIKKHGKLNAKAFPGRSAILIKLLNLDETKISKVFEKPGSMKIGYNVPGTKIPIYSDDDFNYNEKKPVINLAWHISDEIKKYLHKNGFKGEIIDIISPNDF